MSQFNFRKYLTNNMVDAAQSISGGINITGKVISNAINTAAFIGMGNLVRITVTAGAPMFIAFGDSSITAPSGAISEISIRLPNSAVEEVYYILATNDYIRANIAATHVEVITV